MFANQRGQDSLYALLHFRVGQRAIGDLKRQPHRNADRTVGDALALIAIEELDAGKRRGGIASGRLNGATNDFRRQGIRDNDRQIAHDEGMARKGSRRVARPSARLVEQIEAQLGNVHAIFGREPSGLSGM